MAEAYTVFANHGEKSDAHAIVKIVDSHGNIITEWQGEKIQVTTKEVTDKITTMLLGVVEHGSGKAAQIPGREVAGKTGSTQVPIEGVNGVKDQWFVGYTPQLVGAVWVGYDRTDRNHYLTTTSGIGTAPIFREMMSKALENHAAVSFNVPHIASFMQREKMKEPFYNLEKNLQKNKDKWQKKIEKEKKKWEKKWKKKNKKEDD